MSMRLGVCLAPVVVLILAVGASVASAASPVRIGGTRYTFAPPPEWDADAKRSKGLVYRCRPSRGTGYLNAYADSGITSLDSVVRTYERRIGVTLKGWKLTGERRLKLRGVPCIYRIYVGSEGGQEVYGQALYCLRDKEAVVLLSVVPHTEHARQFKPAQRALMSLATAAPRPPSTPSKLSTATAPTTPAAPTTPTRPITPIMSGKPLTRRPVCTAKNSITLDRHSRHLGRRPEGPRNSASHQATPSPSGRHASPTICLSPALRFAEPGTEICLCRVASRFTSR